jgi:hypothetical protein
MSTQTRGRGRPPKNATITVDDLPSENSGSETTTPEGYSTPENPAEFSNLTIETIREPNDADVQRRLKKEAIELKITPDIIKQIGFDSGFLMWEDLTEEQKKKAWYEKRNTNYHSGSLFIKDELPPMLCFRRVGKGEKNEYVINLNSGKPTASSQIKKPLSLAMLNIIIN